MSTLALSDAADNPGTTAATVPLLLLPCHHPSPLAALSIFISYTCIGHTWQKKRVPIPNTHVKLLRAPLSTMVGDYIGTWGADVFFCLNNLFKYLLTPFYAPTYTFLTR
jgi:hypothetical protein